MNRIALALAQAIVALALLSAFGWVVKHRTKGDLNLGVANAWVDGLSGFPDRFQQSVEAVQTLPQTFVPTVGESLLLAYIQSANDLYGPMLQG